MPAVGQVVTYRLDAQQVAEASTQHPGLSPDAGSSLPLIITSVADADVVSGHVLLDGPATIYVHEVWRGTGDGEWQ